MISMIFADPFIDYIVILTIFLMISMGIGIFLGFSISLWGDALAVILVGLGSIVVQAFLLPSQLDTMAWILYSTVGTTIGVAVSFLLIEILTKLEIVQLDKSHIVTFPATLLGLIIPQYILMNNTYQTSVAQNWVLFSVIGFGLGMIVISLLNLIINFNFEILETREKDYSAIYKWAIIGLVLGLCYSLMTSRVLIELF